MSEQGLRDTLQRLRNELDSGQIDDPQVRDELRTLVGDIEHFLGRGENAESPELLRQRVSDSLRAFEIEHPRLTALLSQIMSGLVAMGI